MNSVATALGWGASLQSVLTTQGDIIYASAANTPTRLAKSTGTNYYLKNSGTSNNPAWAAITHADVSDFESGVDTYETSHADVLVDGDFATAGLMKTDGAGTYSIITGSSGILSVNTTFVDDDTSLMTSAAIDNQIVSYGYSTTLGTVTSVDMSVPTGLTVAGNPITSSGTLAVTFTAGYAIPTTAKQTEWNAAYAAIHNAVTLNASATTGGLSLSTQEISFRAATNAQTGYATAAHIAAIEANSDKDGFPGFGTDHTTAAYGDHTHSGVYTTGSGASTRVALWGDINLLTATSEFYYSNSTLYVKDLASGTGNDLMYLSLNTSIAGAYVHTGLRSDLNISHQTSQARNIYGYITLDGSSGDVASVFGIGGYCNLEGSGTNSVSVLMYGGDFSVSHTGTNASQTINEMAAINALVQTNNVATITTAYGLRINNDGTGPVTNLYGIYIDTGFDYGTTNSYAIYSASTADSYFTGAVKVLNNLTVNNLYPTTDNTGVVGSAALTWSNGQFTNLTVDSTLTVTSLDVNGVITATSGTSTQWNAAYAAIHNAVTLNASATTGGLSLSTQEISFRAATNAQTGYATAAHIAAIEANSDKDGFPGFGTDHTTAAYGDHTHSGVYLLNATDTFTGNLTVTGGQIITPYSSSIGSSSGIVSVNWNNGQVQFLQLTENITDWVFTNVQNGTACTIIIKQAAAASYTVIFSADEFNFINGSNETILTSYNSINIVTGIMYDGKLHCALGSHS